MKSILITAIFSMLVYSEVLSQNLIIPVDATGKEKAFFITGNVSYAYRLSKGNVLNQNSTNYSNDLRSGISYDLSAYYQFMPNYIIGLKYNVFQSDASISNVFLESPSGESGIGTTSDDTTISYYGVSWMYIKNAGKSHKFSMEVGIGYMHYVNDVEALGNYKYSGGNIGGAIGLSYKYALSEHFAIGPQISVLGSKISSIEAEGSDGYMESINLKDGDRENLIRLDAGISAMYTF